MRNAETILDIIRQRGQYRLPVKDAYRLLFQRDLYLRAYGKLYRNDGAMTPGATSETVDGALPEWKRRMAARRRKTLVVCRACHELIQYGNYDGKTFQRT